MQLISVFDQGGNRALMYTCVAKPERFKAYKSESICLKTWYMYNKTLLYLKK